MAKDAADLAQSGWSIIVLLFPSLGAAISAWSGYVAELPWYTILFWSSGVFCFMVVACANIYNFLMLTTVNRKLRPDFFAANIGCVKGAATRGLSATCFLKLLNRGIVDVYYQLEEVELSLSGKTTQSNEVNKSVALVQAQSDATIYFQTIEGLEGDQINGRLRMKIKYGKSADALRHTLDVLGEPVIGVAFNDKKEPVSATSAMMFKELKYL